MNTANKEAEMVREEKDSLVEAFGNITLTSIRTEPAGKKIRYVGLFSDGVERVCRTSASRYGVVALHAVLSNNGGTGISRFISCHASASSVSLSKWRPGDAIISVVSLTWDTAPVQGVLF